MDVNEGAARIASILGGGWDEVVGTDPDQTDENARIASLFWSNELFHCPNHGDKVRAGDCLEGKICGMCSVCKWRSLFQSGAREQERRRRKASEFVRGGHGGGHVNKAQRETANRGSKASRGQPVKTTLRKGADLSKFQRPVTNESRGAAGRALGTEDKVSFGKQILYVGVDTVRKYHLNDIKFIRFWTSADPCGEDGVECDVALEFLRHYERGSFKLSNGLNKCTQGKCEHSAYKVSSAGLRRALVESGYDVANVTGHCDVVESSFEKDRIWLIVRISSQ